MTADPTPVTLAVSHAGERYGAAMSAEARPEVVEAPELTALAGIFEDDAQLCYLPRPRQSAIDAYLEAAAPYLGGGLRQIIPVDAPPPAERWPDLPGRQAWVDDIRFLVSLYGDLLGCARVAMRLEVIGRAMCPRFHVDRTGIRLLCTWRGPGTEWLESAHADRRKLGHGAHGLDDEDSGLILSAQGIGKVPPHAIALLKGEAWQGNAGRGVIHRSPAVPASLSPRVLLALDAVWDE